MLKKGDKAVDFEIKNQNGDSIKLDDFKGKKIVLYFYPKDDTPGCTIEAKGIRDVYDEILDKGAVVLGVSPDGEASHQKFREKFDLPFHLLSDPNHEVAKAYGAWGGKNVFGKKKEGIIRSTFIIDENKIISKVFPKVTPSKHAKEILEALE